MSEETSACKTCKFWQQYDRSGSCKRFPPQVTSAGQNYSPNTSDYDWCGEHQPKQKPPE